MVNVLDVSHTMPEGDRLNNIFTHQAALMDKYHGIEEQNGLAHKGLQYPLDLHCRFAQQRIKDFAWRITEELGEMLEAMSKPVDDTPHGMDHAREEAIDALHFLVELSIMVGYTPIDLVERLACVSPLNDEDKLQMVWDSLGLHAHSPGAWGGDPGIIWTVGKFIQNLGVLCNNLKNKPWKQTHMMTDVEKFKKDLDYVWGMFIFILKGVRLTPQTVFETYIKKNAVNQFRQRSKY